ncbi:hypothetical protein AMTR_s00087p00049130, partial [Amborella trichopoda]
MRGQVIHNSSPHCFNQKSPDGNYILVLQDDLRQYSILANQACSKTAHSEALGTKSNL